MAKIIYEQSKSPTPCAWAHPATKSDPHYHEPYSQAKLLYTDVLDAIGHTPLVRINKITRQDGIQCEIYAKLEYLNPGGSVKDRIGLRMVVDAEKQGRIRPGVHTIIEATSGNTGIGLALACAIRGYRCIVTLPEKMSNEKVASLKALGAEVIRTPTEAAFDSPDSHLGVAMRLQREIPNAVILDQYGNPSNPLAHYDQTAEEIIEQMGGRLDYVFCTAGTGGTLAGISRKIKEKLPTAKVIGVDPIGSILAQPATLNGPVSGYKIEGIGYDFLPRTCLRDSVDSWVKTGDRDSFLTARRLIRDEGILCGGSSGAAMWAALEVAKTAPASSRMVVILPDSIRNYLSKFISDEWMYDAGFLPAPVAGLQANRRYVRDMRLPQVVAIDSSTTASEALDRMDVQGFSQLAVFSDNKPMGAVSVSSINEKMMHGQLSPRDPVNRIPMQPVKVISPDTSVQELFILLKVHPFVLVKFEHFYAIATPMDLAKYLKAFPKL